MSEPGAAAAAVKRILDDHPLFTRSVTDFMMMLDAERVLRRTQPPMWETAAQYLHEVGLTLMRETGLPEEFIQACISSQPVAEAQGQGHRLRSAS